MERPSRPGAATGDLAPQHPPAAPVPALRALIYRTRTWDRVALVVAGVSVGLLLHIYVFAIVVIEGDSMAPSLHQGDRILVEKVTPRLGVLERGDVVLLRKPGSNELVVKRVVAIGGDSVRAAFGQLYVNDEPVDEREYAVVSWWYGFSEYEVGPDEAFVLGDNRLTSDDSARWGPVAAERVIGRCICGPLFFPRVTGCRRPRYALKPPTAPGKSGNGFSPGVLRHPRGRGTAPAPSGDTAIDTAAKAPCPWEHWRRQGDGALPACGTTRGFAVA